MTVRVDGAGNLLFAYHNTMSERMRLELRRQDGSLVANIPSLLPQYFLIDQNQGFHLLGPRSQSDPTVVLHVLTAAGVLTRKPQTFAGSIDAVPLSGNGTLLSHSLRISSTQWRVEAFVLEEDGDVSAGPLLIADGTGERPPSAIIGSSARDSALVLFDSSGVQDGTRWSARWLRPSGGMAGGRFDVAENLPRSRLRLIPLLSGELGLRAGEAWLGRLRPFQRQLLLAPPWLAARPEYEVAPIGAGHGLGLYQPSGDFSCTNFVVVHTPTGTSCKERTVPTPPPPCHDSTLQLTRTGTLLQFAPFSSEPGTRIRWWTGQLNYH